MRRPARTIAPCVRALVAVACNRPPPLSCWISEQAESFVINPLLQAHQKAKPTATKASPGISYEWRAGHCWRPPWRSARLQPCCRPPAWASRMRNLTQASLLQSVGANCVPPAIEFCLRTREPPRQAAGGDIPTFAVRNPNA